MLYNNTTQCRLIDDTFKKLNNDVKMIMTNEKYKSESSKLKRVVDVWNREWQDLRTLILRGDLVVVPLFLSFIKSLQNMLTLSIATELGCKNIVKYVEMISLIFQLFPDEIFDEEEDDLK